MSGNNGSKETARKQSELSLEIKRLKRAFVKKYGMTVTKYWSKP